MSPSDTDKWIQLLQSAGFELKDFINKLAKSLGVAAENVYPVLRKQAFLDGIWHTTAVLVCVILMVIFIRMMVMSHKKYGEDYYQYFGYWIGVIGNITVAIVAIVNLRSALQCFINPDWYIFNTLIKDLIEGLQNKTIPR
jgi:uncharacterized membrane protein